MKAAELREKTKEELAELAESLRKRAAEFRFGVDRKKIKNTKELFHLRRTIARILTVMRNK